jgi:hypothetical protein
VPSRRVALPDLTDEDFETLERALGKTADRGWLVQRVSHIIREIVRIAIEPKPQDRRPELQRLARQGRLWLRQVTTCHADSKLLINTNFKQLEVEVNLFCDQIDAIRREYGGAVKAGPPRRRLLLQVFIGEMIGIAKLVKVLPSTPGRAILPTRPPPAFFGFVKEALAISRKVVRTSSLTEAEKKSALSVFSVRGDEALVKQIELVRGRIGDYRDTPHGLSEWPKS